MYKLPCVREPLLSEVHGVPWLPRRRVKTDAHFRASLILCWIPLNTVLLQKESVAFSFILFQFLQTNTCTTDQVLCLEKKHIWHTSGTQPAQMMN